MGGRRILSDEQIEEMCLLREKGWGIDRIAEHFTSQGTKISGNAINWQCMANGADAPKHLRGRSTQAAVPYCRNGYEVRPYSQDEDDLLIELSAQGATIAEMSRRLPTRKHNSIKGRLLTLARIEARAEDLAA